jgi:hypothetical protein
VCIELTVEEGDKVESSGVGVCKGLTVICYCM